MTGFWGYRRPDGRVGIRNKILILPASVCASDTANQIAARVKSAVSFHNQSGCAQVPGDARITMDVMAGFAANPNIYGTVVISLGCETCQMDWVEEEIRKRTNKPFQRFIIQECGGTINTVEKAVRAAQKMALEASDLKREMFPLSELIVGTECGGSDPTSGIASNPLIGEICDKLVDLGGTAILSETTEFLGGEHILAKRGANDEISQRIIEIVHRYEKAMALVGESIRDGNPTPGNIAGGLTTLEEKSLGCIHKGGHRTIEAVYEYAQLVDHKGLVIMDTPGYDTASVVGMVAGGAQLVVFSTGRGTPTGNPIAPVIKITANPNTYRNMSDNIDFDASVLLNEPERMNETKESLWSDLLATINGRLSKSEILGIQEISMARLCNFV